MLLAEVVEQLTPESLDAYLAGLPEDCTINMHSHADCYLARMWRPLVDGILYIYLENAVLYHEENDLDPDRVAFPAWLVAWQHACLLKGAMHFPPSRARAMLRNQFDLGPAEGAA